MSLWSRIGNVFRGDKVNRELDEEFASHLEEAIASGRDPEEVRRAFGSALRQREKSREFRVAEWMESLRADLVFGWRQLMKRKVMTAAAVLSLALGIGSCLAAYRLVDALLLRPLPVRDPGSLYVERFSGLNGLGKPDTWDWVSYPLFDQMRAEVKNEATLMAVDYSRRVDLTYGGYQEMEHAYQQPVSGSFFDAMGLQPALGRLLSMEDDRAPKIAPVAVISYNYWTQRFVQRPDVVGQHFRKDDIEYEIVGVAPKGFTGTEPGTMVDVYTPTMMEDSSRDKNDFSMRVFLRPMAGASLGVLENKLDAVFQHSEKERSKRFNDLPANLLAGWPNAHLQLKSAGEGVSGLQDNYRPALWAMCVLVALVLLIACANVANLMAAQTTARAREIALRMAIGSSRARLVRLVLVQSAMIGAFAAALGAAFAAWAAPFVVSSMSSQSAPLRIDLPMDWKVAVFGLALTFAVTMLFGLMPAVRASGIEPTRALKGDEPQAARRTMHLLIAAQVSVCFVVLFVAGLFTTTFATLLKKPLGFVPQRVLLMLVEAKPGQQPGQWDAMLDAIRHVPGVEKAGMSDRVIAGGMSENDSITVNGVTKVELLTYFLNASPEWIETMRIPLLAGRDFRKDDMQEKTALVNQTFVKTYFDGRDPVGRTFTMMGSTVPITIVGVVGDAAYKSLRGVTLPQAYQPMRRSDGKGGMKAMRFTNIAVRTSSDVPMALAETIRKTVLQTNGAFRVSSMKTQTEVVEGLTLRERLLATLGAFFAGVALLLAAVGLYGVLHYSVTQREREIGIRIALGAEAGNIARVVSARVFAMVLLGAGCGVVAGLASVRFIESLLYGVKGHDVTMMLVPGAVLLGAAAIAALPVVLRAVRIDPAVMLRAE